MPLFSPLLRLFMVFLNIYDTFKTLKEPPSKYRRGPEGEFYGPSARAVVQRKRDLKGCLAVWIVWCCFTLYERFGEPIIYLFIPFYDEFKSIALLFLILTRARGAEPIFLHVIRPFIRPYNKTIDTSLEFARMIGDMLFALVLVPLDFLQPWVRAYAPWSSVQHVVEPHHEVRGQEMTKSEYTVRQNGRVQSYVKETQMNEVRTSQSEVIPPEFFGAEYSRPQSEPALCESYPYLHPAATMSMPVPQHFSNLSTSAPPTPDEIQADLEWRKYAPLPSAYPPTPLVGSSTTLPRKAPISTSFDVVPEDSEDGRQDFYRSLLPPREPLNPGSGKRGLSDDDDGGSSISNNDNAKNINDIWMGGSGGNDIEIDAYGDVESDDGDDDYVDEDEEDDFNVTLQTPRAPLPLHPQSGSTIRTRASARSFVAELERSKQSSLIPPALETPSTSEQSLSSRLTTNPGDTSFRTQDVELGSLSSESESLSASASLSVSDVSEPDSGARVHQFGLQRLEDTDDDHPALLSEHPDSTLDSPTQNGLKRSYSRSFSPERTVSRLPSSRRRQMIPDIFENTNSAAPEDGYRGGPLQQLSSTRTSNSQGFETSDSDELNERDVSRSNADVPEKDKIQRSPKGALITGTKAARATGKRRKIVPKTSSNRRPSTEGVPPPTTSTESRKSKRSPAVKTRPKSVAARNAKQPVVGKLVHSGLGPARNTRASSRAGSARSSVGKQDGTSSSSGGTGDSSSYPLRLVRERRSNTTKKV